MIKKVTLCWIYDNVQLSKIVIQILKKEEGVI